MRQEVCKVQNTSRRARHRRCGGSDVRLRFEVLIQESCYAVMRRSVLSRGKSEQGKIALRVDKTALGVDDLVEDARLSYDALSMLEQV